MKGRKKITGHAFSWGMMLVIAGILVAGCATDGIDGQVGPAGEDGLSGADGTDGVAGADGEPAGPIIANLSTIGSPVYPGGQIQIHVSASSPAGATLTYTWQIPDGWSGEDTGDKALVLTAPNELATQGEVVVAVSDGEHTRTGSVQLATRGPSIDSFTAGPLTPPLNHPIHFTAAASNLDGVVMRYHYNVGGLRYEDRGTEFTWWATQRAMGGIYALQTIVEDGTGLTATAGINTVFEGISPWPAYGGDRQRSGRSRNPDAHGAIGNHIWDTGANITEPVHTAPVIGRFGSIFVASEDEHLYSLNPADGNENWAFNAGAYIGGAAIAADGTVYVSTMDGMVYALRRHNGTVVWSFETNHPNHVGGIPSAPTVGPDGTIYVGSLDDRLYALDPLDGSLRWFYQDIFPLYNAPSFGPDGTLYVMPSFIVHAMDPRDGTVKWSYRTHSNMYSSPAIGEDGTIYMAGLNGVVHALDPANGNALWTHDTGSNTSASPAIASDGTIYVGAWNGKLYALDPVDGSEQWAFDSGARIESSPAIGYDGTIYFGSNNGRLYALAPSDGAEEWSYLTGDAIRSSPAIAANGTLYVGSDDGKVYAIR